MTSGQGEVSHAHACGVSLASLGTALGSAAGILAPPRWPTSSASRQAFPLPDYVSR